MVSEKYKYGENDNRFGEFSRIIMILKVLNYCCLKINRIQYNIMYYGYFLENISQTAVKVVKLICQLYMPLNMNLS